MGIEIEKKFLVVGNAWKTNADPPLLIKQGYISKRPEGIVRVRVCGEHGFLTIKGTSDFVARPEFEYEIPLEEALYMLSNLCDGCNIEKKRFDVYERGVFWEVDEFIGMNEGLTLAEVELGSKNKAFPVDLPDWIGEDVSNDRRYFNSSLSDSPFKMWNIT